MNIDKLNTAPSVIIISIRSQYAEKIFLGQKTVELRRVRPQKLEQGSIAIVYVPSPVQAITGFFEVAQVIEQPKNKLWKRVKNKAGISEEEFNNYYADIDSAVGIFIKKTSKFLMPVALNDLRENNKIFSPPQSFRYATLEEQQLTVTNI